MTTPEIVTTAHHEAGHVVASLVLGCPFHHVDIIPSGTPPLDTFGHMQRGWPDEIAKYEIGKTAAEIADNELIILYAGSAAANRHTGRRCQMRLNMGDYEKAVAIATDSTGNRMAVDPLLTKARRKANVLIRDHWGEVETVANGLLTHERLTSYHVDLLINE